MNTPSPGGTVSSRLSRGLAALAVLATAAACGQGTQAPQEPAPASQPAIEASTDPGAPAGVSASGGWLSLPAVPGNPGSAYFTLRNRGAGDLVILAADLAGAGQTMLHETTTSDGQARMNHLAQVPVAAGGEVVFAPGGKHVMAFDLDQSLQAGSRTEMTLTFANGDKVSFPLDIRPAGSAPAHSGAM